MDISDWRKKIDEIDQEIIRLLNQRAGYSMEICKIKNHHGYSIHDPDREKKIFRSITQCNNGPLSNQAMLNIYQAVVQECRNLQQDNNA